MRVGYSWGGHTWAGLDREVDNSPYLQGLPQHFELPIAHAEGRFVARTPELAASYAAQGLVTLRYSQDVNGSMEQIAGIQSESRRVFGLMPHPERFLYSRHHYDQEWTSPENSLGWGYLFFRSIFNNFG